MPLGDDAAVLADGRCWTVDTLVEGVHFDGRLDAEDLGWKVVAVSVSDLAAMGARPRWLLLSLSLPTPTDAAWVTAFARGLHAACARWGVTLIGGDTTGSPGPRVISGTLGGELAVIGAQAGLRRSGARVGDLVFTLGTLGAAGAGWRLAHPPAGALQALRRPDPPVEAAVALARAGLLSAALDLSDGLATDLPRLCAASGVGAAISASALPIAPCIRDLLDARDHALFGGEDYTLLFTAPARHQRAIEALAAAYGRQAFVLGAITRTQLTFDGAEWPRGGFRHFGETP